MVAIRSFVCLVLFSAVATFAAYSVMNFWVVSLKVTKDSGPSSREFPQDQSETRTSSGPSSREFPQDQSETRTSSGPSSREFPQDHSETPTDSNPDLSKFDVPRLSHPQLPRALNETEYEQMGKLVKELDRIFRENNISYALAYGSLLGSYMVHDILPWDDDVDLWVPLSDFEKMWNLFHDNEKYSHMEMIRKRSKRTNPYAMTKVYFKKGPHAGGYTWRWPFIDIMTVAHNETHVWRLRNTTKPLEVLSTTESFFPFHERPFFGLWVPAPKDPLHFLRRRYRSFVCKSHKWDHKNERGRRPKEVDCKDLVSYYPVVHRTPGGAAGVWEALRLDNRTLYSLWVDESNSTVSQVPFSL